MEAPVSLKTVFLFPGTDSDHTKEIVTDLGSSVEFEVEHILETHFLKYGPSASHSVSRSLCGAGGSLPHTWVLLTWLHHNSTPGDPGSLLTHTPGHSGLCRPFST
jgi:hypothetical protein